jgi:hypothetical protein
VQAQNPRLKIGVLTDSELASIYTYRLTVWAQTKGNVQVSHLMLQKEKPTPRGRITKAFNSFQGVGQVVFGLIEKIEKLRVKRLNEHKDHCKRFDLTSVIPETVYLGPQISIGKTSFSFSDDDIQRVSLLDLDLIINCCSCEILPGNLVQASKLGIISFQHNDSKINRAGPPGFWEVYSRQDATEFVIQQIKENLNCPNVLLRGRFPTKSFYLLNQSALYKRSNHHLLRLLDEIASTGTLPPARDTQPYSNKLIDLPNLTAQFLYISKQAGSIAQKIIRRLLKKEERWGVAFAKGHWKTLVLSRSNRIDNPPNHFLADPFVVMEGNRHFCFVEDYDCGRRKGCISVYELQDKTAERLGVAITEPFHMSFPYLFRYNKKLYMCPETCEKGEIRLYENVKFPLQWKLSHIIMNNVVASDTMIFEKDGSWWLLTNIDPVEADCCSELYIFFSESPLTDTWTPHPKNPIFIDSFKARNGGILFHQGSIYRVAQKQGFGRYGKSTSINRIDVLTKQEYSETQLCLVEPNFFRRIKATHHLHCNDSVSVFDFVEVAKADG